MHGSANITRRVTVSAVPQYQKSIDHKRHYVKRVLMALAPAGVLAGIRGVTEMLSFDQQFIRHTKKLALNIGRQGLWLVQSGPRSSGLCGQDRDRISNSPSEVSFFASNNCLLDVNTAWEEWRACTNEELSAKGWAADELQVAAAMANVFNGTADVFAISKDTTTTQSIIEAAATPTGFNAFIVMYRDRLPWTGSNYTAVLLEFRFLEERLRFSINNALNNLPIHWRIQIVGGTQLCDGVHRLYPFEVAAGKIVPTNIGDRIMDQVIAPLL